MRSKVLFDAYNKIKGFDPEIMQSIQEDYGQDEVDKIKFGYTLAIKRLLGMAEGAEIIEQIKRDGFDFSGDKLDENGEMYK